jgi:dihydromonapterin reductase/dihydrofolate reductase
MLENIVLITGCGRRVGFHLAQRLKQQGYNVLAQYRTHTDEVDRLTDMGVQVIQADLVDTQHILRFIEQVKTQCHSIRAIIHNASSFSPTEDSLEAAAAQYDAFYTVHMKAPYLINQALHSIMKGDKDLPADIIHITDINVENPTPKFDIYGTTKAGLHNMMLVLAKKFAPQIKVNAVAPGPVMFTPLHSQQVIDTMLSETPLAKEGGPEPVYLAVKSILDNPFMTGVSIAVDGGRRLSKR